MRGQYKNYRDQVKKLEAIIADGTVDEIMYLRVSLKFRNNLSEDAGKAFWAGEFTSAFGNKDYQRMSKGLLNYMAGEKE